MTTSSSKNQPLNYYDWRRAMGATASAYEQYLDQVANGGSPEVEKRYTRAQVEAALNQAANLVQDENDGYEDSTTLAVDSAVNLVANVAGYLLGHPAAGLEDAIAACYQDVELDDGDFGNEGLDDPLPKRGSQAWNEALVDKVLGWIS